MDWKQLYRANQTSNAPVNAKRLTFQFSQKTKCGENLEWDSTWCNVEYSSFIYLSYCFYYNLKNNSCKFNLFRKRYLYGMRSVFINHINKNAKYVGTPKILYPQGVFLPQIKTFFMWQLNDRTTHPSSSFMFPGILRLNKKKTQCVPVKLYVIHNRFRKHFKHWKNVLQK